MRSKGCECGGKVSGKYSPSPSFPAPAPPSLRAIRSNRVYGAMREKRIRNEKGMKGEKGYQADLGNEKA